MARVGITYSREDKLKSYVDAVSAVGLEPIPIHPPGPQNLDGLDGLVVSGGTDLNPALYGQSPGSNTETADDPRDAMELQLLRLALDQQLPVLCICRGLQLLNVAFGGELVQHLPSANEHVQRGVVDAHLVRTVEGSQLESICGAGEFAVNSRHHQAVSKLGEGLVISGYSSDDVVEGLEVPGHKFVVAVQWHPEDRVPLRDPDTKLFTAFAKACGL